MSKITVKYTGKVSKVVGQVFWYPEEVWEIDSGQLHLIGPATDYKVIKPLQAKVVDSIPVAPQQASTPVQRAVAGTSDVVDNSKKAK